MKINVLFLLVCILLAGCTSDRISQVVAFGDQYSDIGNTKRIGIQAYANGENKDILTESFMNWYKTNHWEGRLSNGPLAVEVLSERLGVELKDYAVGGAKSGNGNADDYWLEGLKNTGILTQVDQYTGDLNGEKADPKALYFLQASTNDFFGDQYTYDEKAINERADQAVANLVTAVTNLAKLGARRFMVGKSADLTRVPLMHMAGVVAEATSFQTLFNAKLITEMTKLEQQLNIKIDLFDYTAAYDRIWSNPDQYGFVNLVDNCLATDEAYNATICESPDTYFWWDPYSLTRRAHQVIGEAMADQLSK
jgi:cholinesterase